MRRSLTILTYHRVLPDGGSGQPLPWLCVSVSSFRRQMERLARTCRVLPLPQAVAEFAAGPPTRPIVAVTFDDGYLDNHEHAAPILEANGLRGTFFVTTGLVARQELPWWDRFLLLLDDADAAVRAQVVDRVPAAAFVLAGATPLLDRLQAMKDLDGAARSEVLRQLQALAKARPTAAAMMTPDHVRDLARRGHAIGSHTVNHPLLPELDDAEIARELVESRAALQQWLGQPVEAFCYPNGDTDARVAAAVAKAGYRLACTTVEGRNAGLGDLLRLRRIEVRAEPDGADPSLDDTFFRLQLSGALAWAKRLCGR
jgi:peptidoglycan/xylan/chitin deacetylase (PgdA/CDA1 family)